MAGDSTSNGISSNGVSSNGVSSNGVSSNGSSSKGGSQERINVYQVRVSKRFVTLSVVSCILVAYAIGRTARILLFVRPQIQLLLESQSQLQDMQFAQKPDPQNVMKLPNPVLKNGKLPPPTLYTSKNFDTARSSTINSRWVVTEGAPLPVEVEYGDDKEKCDEPSAVNEANPEEEVHLPAGQHLLMDIRNVDAGFLASEERLAGAMLEVVGQCGLTLLSYHCHGLEPSGVTCVGVLLESHVSFHTWPTEGVITLDLFTCGANSLLPIVTNMERLFSIPRENQVSDPPETIWAYKVRGFGDETTEELTDLFTFPIGAMTEYKKEVASVRTANSRVDVYDVLRPHFQTFESYKRSLQNASSYEFEHAAVFQPDRIVFVNGILQSRRSGDASYHESLVHPAMFAHENPERVAILGGGEGAILREVLKHKTVKEVVVVMEDDSLLNLTHQHFPEYHDCSSFNAGFRDCFDDPRVEVVLRDINDWMEDKYGDDIDDNKATIFDVMILDDNYYVGGIGDDDQDFLQLLTSALSETGMFVTQVGEAESIYEPSQDFTRNHARHSFVTSLVELGFEDIQTYEESHSGFGTPWKFVIAFRSFHSRTRWRSTDAEVNLWMRQRTNPGLNGNLPFLYFDGPTSTIFSKPSRASETVFCRGTLEQEHEECKDGHGFDPERENLPTKVALEVKESTLGQNTGRGVFAKVDIPHSTYVGLEELVHPLVFRSPSLKTIYKMSSTPIYALYHGTTLRVYSTHYGHVYSYEGQLQSWVDSSVQQFVNHGCNGTSNFGYIFSLTEANDDAESRLNEMLYFKEKDYVHNPAGERQPHYYPLAFPMRDIRQGEEIFVNYLAFTGDSKSDWLEDLSQLRAWCSGGAEPEQ